MSVDCSSSLSSALVRWCESNGIDASQYTSSAADDVPRYIRLTRAGGETRQSIAEQFSSLQPTILPTCFALPSSTIINKSLAYRRGGIAGIDLASILAVTALAIPTDSECHVLDLCCSPAAKLSVVADEHPSAVVTGVDVSLERMYTARAILLKYDLLQRTRLFLRRRNGLRYASCSHHTYWSHRQRQQ